ncbi:PIR protein [Plasmodium yoelii]|uniref:PIR protein n=2 Tax=Plasmodium yoelii TaxID=5861 RepID=A0AAE9WJ66_PLAYO|nr:PIR protein [Plasmodium yoelii]WBY54888.1 PIR protein [Plasmodium yoelii yoelii]CDS44751.1 YIR protein [Plasmodium yoelii]VTZ71922.1 PIR protein [Plasmodium yoelii]|eukprot:XP_022810762.1 PIR protein [Plasmodium yoelii]
MDNRICGRFDLLRKFLSDELKNSTSKDIHNLGSAKNYCPKEGSENKCKTEVDKINAGFLWLLEQNIINNISDFSDASDEKHKVFIIYIMLWLNFKLNQKNDAKSTQFNDFYNNYIENNTHYTKCKKKTNNNNYEDCSSSLKEATGYNNFKEFIEANKCLMNIKFKDVSDLYDAFKSLCNMYTELDANDTTDKKYLENAKTFVEKYDELNKNPNVTKDNPYYQVLSTLSNDYNNFKKFCNSSSVDCNDIPSLSPIKIKENSVQSSERNSLQNSGVTSSSSSITNKLIPVVSIIAAIPIFVGIAYKYSLFGFRKRSQKQQIREKIKK